MEIIDLTSDDGGEPVQRQACKEIANAAGSGLSGYKRRAGGELSANAILDDEDATVVSSHYVQSTRKKRVGKKKALQYEGNSSFLSKRRERRERDAKVRSGEQALPSPVIDFDSTKAARMQRIARCEIEVYLPKGRPPYRSQLQVMDGALRACKSARSAFLESPTGTGKTLAALASVLAWQRSTVATKPTRVVWVARTHDQLQHAVHEYRASCCERPLMSLRLSRERFCLHPDIAIAPNKAEACEEATKIPKNLNRAGRFDVRHSGCAHLDKAEAIGYPQSSKWRKHFRLGGAMETWDIEDAVAEGKSMMVCPFHMAQDQIQDGAALIFITFQQLVEPITRRAGGLEQVIEDAVIVVDEAHNLPQLARDAASLKITEARLVAIIDTLRSEFLPRLNSAPEHAEASDMLASLVSSSDAAAKTQKKMRFQPTERGGPLVSLLGWLRDATAGLYAPLSEPAESIEAHDEDNTERVWDGDAAAKVAREVVGLVSADRVDDNCKLLWKLRKTLIEEGLESGAVRSDIINDLEAILVKLRYLLEPSAARHFRLVVDAKQRTERSLSFVCLSGSVAMHTLTRGQRTAGLGEAEYLRPARSLLLLSGTLRPFDLLATELGFEIVEDIEMPPPQSTDQDAPMSHAFKASCIRASHLSNVDKSLLPLHLSQACGVQLDASYKNATHKPDSARSRSYLDALGTALLGVASASPNGMLVFFKSYKLLHVAINRWTSTDAQQKLAAAKTVFVEEQGLAGEEFDRRLFDYRTAAKTTRGAVLLAVMRGRAAEGADFKDEAARVCVVVGLPYPPRFELATRLKVAHQADLGERWYRAEAFRNVNQAAGRLIRHKSDYGALILLDRALAKHPLMSEWFANRLQTLPGATLLHRRLNSFFNARPSASECASAPS